MGMIGGRPCFSSIVEAIQVHPLPQKSRTFGRFNDQKTAGRPSGTKFPIASRIRSNQPRSRRHGSPPWQTCNHQQQVRPYSTAINLAPYVPSRFIHSDRLANAASSSATCRIYRIHLGRLWTHRSLTRRRDLNCTPRRYTTRSDICNTHVTPVRKRQPRVLIDARQVELDRETVIGPLSLFAKAIEQKCE